MLRYTLSKGGPALILTELALSTITRYCQRSPRAKEAGGQLFARFEGADTIISEATSPNWLDRRSRNGFIPNRWMQQREIRNQYECGLHFVGDWHTHPEPIPRPSQDDIYSMIDCFGHSLHDLHAFVLIIAGTMPASEGLYVAVVDRNSTRQLSLEDM